MKRRDFVKAGAAAMSSLAVGELIRLWPGAENITGAEEPRATGLQDGAPRRRRNKSRRDYRQSTPVPSTCLNCSSCCGIVGHVIDGRLVKLEGNPEDPNVRGKLCARGQSGVSIPYYPERLLYPLRRVGRRGEGLWKRITWDEAYDEMIARLRAIRDSGHPEHVAFHYGRSRVNDIIERFMYAYGSPVILNHRALCSLNRRAVMLAHVGDSDWDTNDVEHTKYMLNFGSNFYEAHQGHLHLLQRVIRGRFDNGAKLVTFDVRLSNTAGRSDEWFANFPGTEGLIALAMANVIMQAGEFDREFLDTWTTYPADKLAEYLKPYTPEWAERESGVPAADIRRIALEFAACRPACTTISNRGSMAHYNGFHNDRAISMLNAIVGSVGKPGGYCYTPGGEVDRKKFPPPEPVPAKPKLRTDLEDPPEWPLANYWRPMKVGQIVYDYIQQGRATVKFYFSYTLGSPTTWPEGRSRTVDVLRDERLIPFHVCSDIVYSETAHYADMILPDATYLERWGLDTRNNYELVPYITLRQPIVPPPAECRDITDTLIELGRRYGGDVATYFPCASMKEYVAHQCRVIPPGDCASGFEYMCKHGVFIEKGAKGYETFKRPLSAKDLDGSRTDEKTGVIFRRGPDGREEAIGVKVGEAAYRGFQTPSRKFEIYCPTVIEQSRKVGVEDNGLPRYEPVPSLEDLPADRFVLTTFKWNVHTQARTAPQKWLTEIVHDNPLWMNTATAAQLGVRSGDWVELTTYRPRGNTVRGDGGELGSVRVRVFVTEGIHPRVVALSNSLGHTHGGRTATARRGPRGELPAFDQEVLPDDPDLIRQLWWDSSIGGRGAGHNINAILPIQPSPVTGMQSWYDTVCSVRKV